ncbi:MAG: hypothetical protein M1835_005063 [Candelina submexicana]|nr:MAG: hypothetical protein M1835_005063 [Candelina submexicana]
MNEASSKITVGVLALQGAFNEHVQLLRQAAKSLESSSPDNTTWEFREVRTPQELSLCDALIIPGGESTTMSLVAARSCLLDPLRDFVKVKRQPTWGTCAGLILLAESANRTKKGGQELIGGLDVRVNRNHFGRQVESFEANLDLPFLASADCKGLSTSHSPFKAMFIRAPVVEKILPAVEGVQVEEKRREETVIAPARETVEGVARAFVGGRVEVMAELHSGRSTIPDNTRNRQSEDLASEIIAIRQGNVFGTSFHPELTGDARIHVWWLREVKAAVAKRR